MENNTAFVASLGDIKEIPGADNIIQATVYRGNLPQTTVVVGKDTPNIVVYFDSNLCLDPGFIEALDKADPEYGAENFRSVGAYLGKNGRVRAVKLRGTISNGLVIAADRLKIFFKSEEDFGKFLIREDGFTEISGTPVCKKYEPPAAHENKKATLPLSFSPLGFFPEHVETMQLARNFNIRPDDIIHISEKWHGTSARTGHVPIQRKLKWYEKFISRFIRVEKFRYGYAHGSRRVVKHVDGEAVEIKQHFYGYDLWKDAGEKYFRGKLHKGEMVFYEIVGYLPDGKPIQRIGKFVYNYGAGEKEYKIIVYRMTLTNEDGYTVEYSPEQLKLRCSQMGVEYVRELYYGTARSLFPDIPEDSWWPQNFLGRLQKTYLEKVRNDCSKNTPDEGIVVRVNNEFFKLKSAAFFAAESKSFEEDTVVDMEG